MIEEVTTLLENDDNRSTRLVNKICLLERPNLTTVGRSCIVS
jgi:hypothetical protein